MTYRETQRIVQELHEKDRHFMLNAEIVCSVHDNMHTKDMTDEEFEKLCKRISETWLEFDGYIDLSEMCYQIQDLIDCGDYEAPTEECIREAASRAQYQF